MFAALLALVACHSASDARGVYRSGPNAVARGARSGEVRVWGPKGTVVRSASAAPSGDTWLGEAGPLWIVDRDVPAPPASSPVDAVMVERAGYRMKDILGTVASGAPDAAKSGGTYVRSVVKVRRDKAPPVFVVSATGDEVGAGRFGGPADVRAGENCKGAVGLLDHKGEKLLAAVKLEGATAVCAVPVLVPPVDIDEDGKLDVLVYGQNGTRGFRAWFEIDGETLVPGPAETWEAIP